MDSVIAPQLLRGEAVEEGCTKRSRTLAEQLSDTSCPLVHASCIVCSSSNWRKTMLHHLRKALKTISVLGPLSMVRP